MNDELLNLKTSGKPRPNGCMPWVSTAPPICVGSARWGAYRAVRARGFRASKVLLYAIEGALLDVHWNELSPDHKAALLGELETFPVRNKS